MTCANCGNYVVEGTEACPRCGTLVSRDVTSAADMPAWTPAGGPRDPFGSGDPIAPGASYGSGGPAGPGGSYGSGGPAGPGGSYGSGGPAGPGGSYGPGGPAGPGVPYGPSGPGGPGGPAGLGGHVRHAPSSSGFNFDAARWTRSDKIAGVASLVVLIALFLPWFSGSISSDNTLGLSASSGSESGTAAHGWLWLVFVIVLLILGYLVCAAGFQVLPVKLPLRHDQVLLVAAGVNLLLVFVGFLFKPSTYGIAGLSIGWSIGAFLALIAAIVAVAALTPPGRERLDSGVPTASR
jgi:hypothetical protein